MAQWLKWLPRDLNIQTPSIEQVWCVIYHHIVAHKEKERKKNKTAIRLLHFRYEKRRSIWSLVIGSCEWTQSNLSFCHKGKSEYDKVERYFWRQYWMKRVHRTWWSIHLSITATISIYLKQRWRRWPARPFLPNHASSLSSNVTWEKRAKPCFGCACLFPTENRVM